MKSLRYLLFSVGCLLTCACTDAYLDQKPRSDLVVPHTLADFRQLLDYGPLMFSSSELPEVMSDDYYLEPGYWESFYDVLTKNAHVWAKDVYEATTSTNAWTRPYLQVFYCNVVLDGLKDVSINTQNEAEWKNIQGSALFLRAYAFYELAQLFAPAFDDATADADLGIPLPLISDVNQQITRSSVRQTYTQILGDLENAKQLLWNPVDYSRPSRPALFGLLARVYLSMGDYGHAGEAADESLKLYDDLTDLNDGNRHYSKTVFLRYMNPPVLLNSINTNVQIQESIYESYIISDLRREKYYKINSAGKPYKYAGFYSLGQYFFTGIDTDELFLIRSECNARAGQARKAMDDLNHLLRYRFQSNSHINLLIDEPESALTVILSERRKELVLRNLRWTDLKRLNKEGADITLTRSIGERSYSLAPNSYNWVFPIPPEEISGSGIQQNPRD